MGLSDAGDTVAPQKKRGQKGNPMSKLPYDDVVLGPADHQCVRVHEAGVARGVGLGEVPSDELAGLRIDGVHPRPLLPDVDVAIVGEDGGLKDV